MENDDDIDTEGKGNCSLKMESDDTVRPVSPGESGEGLPYAPVDWPNPGDIWGWKVGYRFSKEGIFYDRFLRIPQRLPKRQTKSVKLQSKVAVVRYLRSEFPEADVNAFFGSFTWVIRIKPELIEKYVGCPRITGARGKKVKTNRGNGVIKKMKKAVKTQKDEVFNENGCINLSLDIALHGEETFPAATSFLGSQVYDDFNFDSPIEETNTLLKNFQGDLSQDEFNNYLKSLDEILDSPHSMQQSSSSMADVPRKKITSLLALGIPNCLLSSENVNELIVLSYQLQNDPNLTMEELSILKLIQSIPCTSKSFLEAKEITSKADEFFNGLNTKIASAASLKEEYNASMEEMEFVKAEEACTLIDIMDIDQEISKLEKIRQEKTEKIKTNREKLVRLNSIQKKVMGNLPNVVHEIQLAKSEESIWEFKKMKAAEEEAEILARYAPLEGFSFSYLLRR